MALSEQLNKFKQQQERCQTTLSSIAANQSSILKPKVTPGFQTINVPFVPVKALQPIKFSNDTERLHRINLVRKSHPGSQIKLVIELLYKTRQAFTAEQINEATYVDIAGNKDVFKNLKKNIKVFFDGKRFSYKAKHVLKGRDELLNMIRKEEYADGLDVVEVIVAYPSVLDDLQALKESGDILWLSGTDSQEGVVYPNDPRSKIMVDKDLKELYKTIELPRDMLDIEKELHKAGEKVATNTAKRREQALIHGAECKPKAKKKPRGITSRSRITNFHLPYLFANMDT